MAGSEQVCHCSSAPQVSVLATHIWQHSFRFYPRAMLFSLQSHRHTSCDAKEMEQTYFFNGWRQDEWWDIDSEDTKHKKQYSSVHLRHRVCCIWWGYQIFPMDKHFQTNAFYKHHSHVPFLQSETELINYPPDFLYLKSDLKNSCNAVQNKNKTECDYFFNPTETVYFLLYLITFIDIFKYMLILNLMPTTRSNKLVQ